jgi:hypothetical protein
MNDSKFANEQALADLEALRKTLAQWLPMSSSMPVLSSEFMAELMS